MKKINIIIRKELQNYFFNPLGYLTAGIVILVANWLFLKDLFLINQSVMASYWSVFSLLMSIFIPAMTMGIFADEKRNNTWEVLKTLPISESDIVWGKFWGSAIFILFTILLSLPILITLLIFGQPQIGLLIGGYLGIIFMVMAYLSLGILISAIASQALVAFLITSIALIFNSFLSQFKYLADLSLSYRSAKFASGLVNLSDLVFFVSWILILNILTILVLKNKKR